jgi:hypothetical protein
MKISYTLLLFLLATVSILAQTPEKMSYQLVLRDASNTLLMNQQVGIQISILQTTITGSAVYTEIQTATTNINGLVSLEIGSGTSSDDFSAIDWSAGPYFIKTATDASGGSNYSIIGTSQLMSVPFALYAKTSNDTPAVASNSAKVGYTEALVSGNTAVAANTLKVGITAAQVSSITDNTAKVGYTEALVSANTAVAANTLKVDTDAVSVNAAGALMDSEVTDLVGIKAVTISTLQVIPSEGAFVNGDKTKLDGMDALIAALEARIAALEQSQPIGAAVGDLRDGGVVFWVDPTDNTQGLVCALQDYQNTVQWGCNPTDLPSVPNVPPNGGNPVGPGAEIGDGESNTTGILADCSSAPAALAARSYGSEWFLPSIHELEEMYVNKATLEAVSGFDTFSNHYWSSTENDNESAWVQHFDNGNQFFFYKNYAFNVRAVRAF